MRIFGREPAAWLGLLGALISWATTMGLDWLTPVQGAVVASAATAVLMALTTRPIAPGLFTAAISALAAVFAEYGLHASDAQVTGLNAVILAAFALFVVRPQVTPEADQAPTALARNAGQVR